MGEVNNNLVIAPPPPVPPPLPKTSAVSETFSSQHTIQDSENEVLSYIESICKNLMPFSDYSQCAVNYSHLKSLIQDGPTCGLVALSMISSCTPKMLSPSEVLHKARQNGFTKKGEMFSASNMALLSKELVGNFFEIKLCHGGLLNIQEELINNLLSGNLFLLPYDADKNHSPANLNGHKAHWAILCGIVKNSCKLFLIGKQSKSRHVALWDLNSLHESNMNLTEINIDKTQSGDYVIEDIKNTLAGKFILFRKKYE